MGLFDFFKKKPVEDIVEVEILYPTSWENGLPPVKVVAVEVLQPTPGKAVDIILPIRNTTETET
jgi:fused signal recognition particle receptor